MTLYMKVYKLTGPSAFFFWFERVTPFTRYTHARPAHAVVPQAGRPRPQGHRASAHVIDHQQFKRPKKKHYN